MKTNIEILSKKKQMIENCPLWSFLDMSIEKMSNGKSLVNLPVTEKLTQLHGNVHGGILATLLDGSMSSALDSELDESEYAVTIEMKINYMSGVKATSLKAEGEVIKRGRNVSVCQAKIYDKKRRILCLATGTFYVFDSKLRTGKE